MKIKVFGIKRYDFTPEGTNRSIVGARIYGIITEPDMTDSQLEGNETFCEAISDISAYSAKVGKDYTIVYQMNRVVDQQSKKSYLVAKPAKLVEA